MTTFDSTTHRGAEGSFPDPARPLTGNRVAVLVQNLPVPFDRRVWQEATTLRDLGAELVVISPSDARFPAGRFVVDGIDVRRYPAATEASGVLGYVREYGTSIAQIAHQLRLAEREAPFDVVHFCNPPDLLFLAALPAKLRYRSRLVFDQHDLGPELVRAKRLPLAPLFVAVARVWEWATYRVADHVISTNESYRGIAMRRGRKAPESVTVVRSGPRRDWPDRGPHVDTWHNGRRHLIGYVGVIGRQEGIEYLLDAMRVLVHDWSIDVQLALVGAGPDVDRLQQVTSGLGLDEHVSFLGRIPDDDLRSVLSSADVCVNPDEVNEMNDLSTMNKIVEYMALGKPIVQFDVREGRVSAEDASLYADANDARSLAENLRRVLEDPMLAARMSDAGVRRFQQHLAWETQVPALTDAYLRVLGGHRRRGR